jgi:hypothetical protein
MFKIFNILTTYRTFFGMIFQIYLPSMMNSNLCVIGVGVGDCVKMVLSGQCKDGTWKETDDDSGECDWNA